MCLEESILSLIFYFNLNLTDKESSSRVEFKDLCEDLDKNFKLIILNERLKIEQDHNEKLKELYGELSNKIKFEDWNSSLKLLKSI